MYNMAGYIKLKKSNCKNCYKCIRNCPVKSISFSANQAQIVEDECILCGMCFVACPQNAKIIRDDVYKAKELLSGDSEVYVSLGAVVYCQLRRVVYRDEKSTYVARLCRR